MDFNRELSLLNSTQFVNSENINAPLSELFANDQTILSLLNGNRLFSRGIYGNLLDYNASGEKIVKNGGRFNSYKKCNIWKALNEFAISNDDDISFDSDNEMMIYKGWSGTASTSTSYNVDREVWIEREFFIPETLRGEQLVFGMKASGSTAASDWSTSNARFESVGIEVIGAAEETRDFVSCGPWANYNDFEPDSYTPAMQSVYVPFRTSKDTKSVRVKIFRTLNDGYFHINRMYLGGVTLAVDNDIETVNLNQVDINNFFDFYNDNVKYNATDVMGHTVAKYDEEDPKANDILLLIHMINKLVTYLGNSSKLPSSTTDNNPEQGIIECDTTNRVYSVTTQEMTAGTSNPIVTLVIPDEDSTIYSLAVTSVTTTSFKVVMSDIPEVTGYKINWSINTLETKDLIDELTIDTPLSSVPPTPTEYDFIFDFEDNY